MEKSFTELGQQVMYIKVQYACGGEQLLVPNRSTFCKYTGECVICYYGDDDVLIYKTVTKTVDEGDSIKATVPSVTQELKEAVSFITNLDIPDVQNFYELQKFLSMYERQLLRIEPTLVTVKMLVIVNLTSVAYMTGEEVELIYGPHQKEVETIHAVVR